ncbi:MAG: DUF1326 domain-containing protein [Planctomycetia bacterium]|nr:DUF1326 domain-containing protein [Planctomycetia bacterium]
MLRFAGCLTVLALLAGTAGAAEISGSYLEARTCDVYTGPCFANAQVGLTGQQAILAWSIDGGSYGGVDLSGLKVVMTVRASDTLGYGGGVVIHPDPIRSVILVDQEATAAQRQALVNFARERAGQVAGEVVRVAAVPIDMAVDHVDMVGELKAGNEIAVTTRKLSKTDCVCSNEVTFYPPLTKVENSEPAYTIDASFTGRGLGARWSCPFSRSAFLATF